MFQYSGFTTLSCMHFYIKKKDILNVRIWACFTPNSQKAKGMFSTSLLIYLDGFDQHRAVVSG